MAHLVITIGCEYGAKGNQIGRKVAEDLGIKFYDRDTVDQIIQRKESQLQEKERKEMSADPSPNMQI